MRVAYLTAAEMVDPDTDRKDAFEHERICAALAPAFARRGMDLEPVVWSTPEAHDPGFDAFLVGTTWDYWHQRDAFLEVLGQLDRLGTLLNPLPLLRWNLDKAYLRELSDAGVPGIPTVWIDDPTPSALRGAFDALGADDVVFKRQVGAGAFGQHRVRRDAPLPELDAPMLAQAFLPSILEHGETSLILVDGQLSHAVRKVAAEGDYRIQSMYGGRDLDHTPTDAELAVAAGVMEAITAKGWGTPTYARVDLVRIDDAPVVIEVEMVEPYLYPEQGPQLGERLAAAVEQRLST